MKRLFMGVLALAAASFAATPVFAACEEDDGPAETQDNPRPAVGASLAEIQENGIVEFAAYDKFAPYSWRESGKAKGVDIALGNALAKAIGVQARFQFVGADETVDDDLRNFIWKGPLISGRVSNVMLHMPYDEIFACRNEKVTITGPYYEDRIAIAYLKKSYPDEAPLPGHFRRKTVGVENDSIGDFYLSGLVNGVLRKNIVRYPDYGAAMRALAEGEISAVLGPKAHLEHGLTSGVALHLPELPGLAAASWSVGLAVHRGYPELAKALDAAVKDLVQSGEMAKIYEEYGLTYEAAKNQN